MQKRCWTRLSAVNLPFSFEQQDPELQRKPRAISTLLGSGIQALRVGVSRYLDNCLVGLK